MHTPDPLNPKHQHHSAFKPKCQTCSFYQRDRTKLPGDYGLCHYDPQTINKHYLDWCSHWEKDLK